MRLEPLAPNCIKDQIVCSIARLGERATRTAVIKSIDFNSSIVAIAIDGLVRDRYMVLIDGVYVLDVDFQASLAPSDRASSVAAVPSTKQCAKCKAPKDATADNFGHDSRTSDGLGNTCCSCKSNAIRSGMKVNAQRKPHEPAAAPAPTFPSPQLAAPERDAFPPVVVQPAPRDTELGALSEVIRAVAALDDQARVRVLEYACSRFGVMLS